MHVAILALIFLSLVNLWRFSSDAVCWGHWYGYSLKRGLQDIEVSHSMNFTLLF
jgi:hypothetical protein